MANKYDQQDDESNERKNNGDSDDTFGLPEINYEPLKRDEPQAEPEPVPQQEQTYSYTEEEVSSEPESTEESQPEDRPAYDPTYRTSEPVEETSVWTKVLGVLGVVIVLLAVVWYFVIYKPKQDTAKEKERIEAQQRAEAQRAREAEEAHLRSEREAAERRRLDSLANLNATPPAGTIETLSERTGRYYVVVASALDDDLLMDYAKKLSKQGITCKIIPPFGKYKVSRISIADGDTFVAAAAKAEQLKGNYGDAVWVLKY